MSKFKLFCEYNEVVALYSEEDNCAVIIKRLFFDEIAHKVEKFRNYENNQKSIMEMSKSMDTDEIGAYLYNTFIDRRVYVYRLV